MKKIGKVETNRLKKFEEKILNGRIFGDLKVDSYENDEENIFYSRESLMHDDTCFKRKIRIRKRSKSPQKN